MPVVDLHKQNFEKTLRANERVLVHFWAPCMLRPHFRYRCSHSLPTAQAIVRREQAQQGVWHGVESAGD